MTCRRCAVATCLLGGGATLLLRALMPVWYVSGVNEKASHSSTTAQSDGAFVSSDVFKLGQMILRLVRGILCFTRVRVYECERARSLALLLWKQGGDKPAQRFAARKDFDARPHSVDNVPMLPRTIAPARIALPWFQIPLVLRNFL